MCFFLCLLNSNAFTADRDGQTLVLGATAVGYNCAVCKWGEKVLAFSLFY